MLPAVYPGPLSRCAGPALSRCADSLDFMVLPGFVPEIFCLSKNGWDGGILTQL